jgi:hypothetical protein
VEVVVMQMNAEVDLFHIRDHKSIVLIWPRKNKDATINIFLLDSDPEQQNHIDVKTWSLLLLHLDAVRFDAAVDWMSLKLEDINVVIHMLLFDTHCFLACRDMYNMMT